MGVKSSQMKIITADRRNQDIAEALKIEHIVDPVTPENVQKLREHLHAGDILLNLSVEVDSVELIKIAQEMGCLYLDTCVEPWAGGYEGEDLESRTNFVDRGKALALLQAPDAKTKPTALIAMGANPGLISLIYKEALIQLARDEDIPLTNTDKEKPPRTQEEWADLSQRVGVKVLHIAERDTQIPKKPRVRGEFLNTWSADGFISEGAHQPAECGWGTHERAPPSDFGGKYHTDDPTHSSVYFDRPGARLDVHSWTPTGPNRGYMITHNEAVSLAEYFTVGDPTKPQYRFTSYYAYHPADVAIMSMDELMGTGKQQEVRRVLKPEEIMPGGMDELGVLLMGHFNTDCKTTRGGKDKTFAYWYGSQLTVDEAVKLCPYNTATTLQVAIGAFVGLVHCIEHPNEGVIESEALDYKRGMDIARQYLGRVGGFRTDWTPLKEIETIHLFHQDTDIDREDVWQFKNFIAF
jgi:homospermidine synthase